MYIYIYIFIYIYIYIELDQHRLVLKAGLQDQERQPPEGDEEPALSLGLLALFVRSFMGLERV